jgi:hypothetical protein
MKNGKHIFAQELFIGFVSKVTAEGVNVHVPSSERISKFLHIGDDFHGGLVNTYVVIEGEDNGFIGKVISTEIPEKERLEISEKAISTKPLHPLIKLEIQTQFDYYDFKFIKSVSDFPNVGAKVYHSRKEVVDAFVKQLEVNATSTQSKTTDFATLLNSKDVKIDVTLQSLFSRHFAVVGTTGGGKSWTTAKLVENIVGNDHKVVLLDATGEYKPLASNLHSLGVAENITIGETHVIPYESLKMEDLFYLTEPSEKSQKPKLLDAVRSLKLIQYFDDESTDIDVNDYIQELGGIKYLVKSGKKRQPLLKELADNYINVNDDTLNFDIRALPLQIENECIYDTGYDKELFGAREATSLGYNISLIGRINSILGNQRFDSIFNFSSSSELHNLVKSIDEFKDNNKKILCINLSSLPFQYNIREIVVNIIGDKLLNLARDKCFITNPMVVMLDEAHQFLNKSLSNDYDNFTLDAFDNIAKEGRKYGLFLGITTQMPRDIPVATLSQIGTFIVHRLINYRDKETIINALSNANRNILSYLPDLGVGEAILSCIELKMPLLIKVNQPNNKPDSSTPKLN